MSGHQCHQEKTITTIGDTFDALATTSPEVEALQAPNRGALTFAGLASRLLQIRELLTHHGIGPKDRLASALPRGPDNAVLFLSVASCATYVPLNPDFTENEFGAYLGELAPKAILLRAGEDSAARRAARGAGIPAIDVDIESRDRIGSFDIEPGSLPVTSKQAEPSDAEDVALVLLTSGTTSGARFVPCKHRHLLAYASHSGAYYGLSNTDQNLHIMPMFHGHGLKSSLLVPLLNGAGVICPDSFAVGSFYRNLDAFGPTWFSGAASILRAIADRVEENTDVARRAKLRFIRSGSSKLDPKVMRRLEDAFQTPVIERYGGSETGTLTSNPMPPCRGKPNSVGKPVFNDVKIIDENGNFLPQGGEGEIVARGPSVVDGYLGNEEATREVFVDGWFRTGDLGRFDEDDYLTIIGRKKDIINRGGEKIGTAEVESAILKDENVSEVCVFPIPHTTLGEEIAAAVVPIAIGNVTEDEVREHTRKHVSGFKVPKLVFLLDDLPKSGTNKVQRNEVQKVCLEKLHTRRVSEVSVPHDWSPLEREIAEIWAAALNIPLHGIRPEDDFFLIGGDSLSAFEMFLTIEKKYQARLGLRHIFDEAANVAGMARLVETALDGGGESESMAAGLVSIKVTGSRPPLFAVPGSGGNPLGFVHLGRLLDERHPFIGIESRGMDGSMEPLRDMKSIAADNIERIKTIQPDGPYYLTGACYGARVAYEMARQLAAANEEVGMLLMLDPSAPFHGADGRPRGERQKNKVRTSYRTQLHSLIRQRIALHAKMLLRLRGRERIEYIKDKLRIVVDMLVERDIFRGNRSELYERAVYAANRHAGGNYIPGNYSGSVIVCFTRGRPVRGPRNFRLDWQDLVPQAGTPIFVPGQDSGDMTNVPHVFELAPLVNRWLDEAFASTTRTQ